MPASTLAEMELERLTTDVDQRLRRMLTAQYELDGETLKPEMNFIEDLGFDSLDQFEIAMSAEDEFGIEIPMEDAEKLVTFADLKAYVVRRKS